MKISGVVFLLENLSIHGGGVANAKPKYPPDASGGYNNILKQNSLNAIVFKLQLINSTEKTSKYLLLSYGMSYRSATLLCYS